MTAVAPPEAPAPSSARPVPDAGTGTVLRVDRVAGLAADRLALALPDAELLAQELDAVEVGLVGAGEAASDRLHALVPLLEDDRVLRRAVLALRRSTRAARPSPPDAGLVGHVVTALAGHGLDAAPVTRWVDLVTARASVGQAFADAVADGVTRTSRALGALRDDPALLTAIADASPDLAADGRREVLLPRRPAARSLLAYATRAAVKTSPFGTLTTVGMPGSAAPHGASVASITHAYAAAWLDVLARDEAAAAAFDVEPLDTGGLDAAREAVGVPVLVDSADVTWRRTARVLLRGTGTVLQQLERRGRLPHRALLEALGGEDPFATYVRLLDAGVLRVVAPWRYGERHALEVLATHLAGAVPGHPALDTLEAVTAGARAVTGALGRERGRLRAGLRRHAEGALAASGVGTARRRFELYVDAAPADPVGPLPAEVATEVDRYVAALGRRVHRSPAYRALVRAFVDAHGVGGSAPSAWRWVLEAGSGDVLTEVVRAAAGPGDGPGDGAVVVLPRGRSMPAPSAALAVQVAHGPTPLLVVNQVLAGQGGLVTRFAPLHPGPTGMAAQVAARATRLAGGGRPVEVVPAWDVNGMQSAASGTLPRLRLPVDQPLAGEADGVALADLRLRHDPLADALELLDRDGTPVVPLHLGLVPAHLVSGPERLLTVLADPWSLPRVGTPPLPRLHDRTRTVALPRRTDGRVVLRRATWTVPLADLPPAGDDDVELLRATSRWRRAAGMPPEVFVRLVRSPPGFDPNARKPVPVELTSPHSLRRLHALVEEAALRGDLLGLEVSEALPASDQHGHRDADGGRRAVEHLLLVDWPTATPTGLTTAGEVSA